MTRHWLTGLMCAGIGAALTGLVPYGTGADETQKANQAPAVPRGLAQPASSAPASPCDGSCSLPVTATADESSAEPVYKIVSPVGESTAKMTEMARRLDTLEGKTVGMVWNHDFKANVTLSAIAEDLKKRYPGIKIVPYSSMPEAPLLGTPGPGRQKYDPDDLVAAYKAQHIDAVITGNGGCGICTPRAAQAAVLAERLGIPAVVTVNPGFDAQARKVARAEGIPAIQVAVYPDPFDLETDAQLREKSARILLPQIIEALTKPVPPAPKQSAAEKDNRAIVFTGTIDDINRYVTDKGWSDGLAITPPTREKVEEFLKYTAYAPDEEIAVLPLANLRATPWNIAVNGVMAGCRPEYMPILIAAVQVMGDPDYHYRLYGGSTHGFTCFFWVNGPIARQLGIDHGQGLIANPVNAVLGRAMTLIERNIAGFRIKDTQMGSFGKQPIYFLAEDEDAMRELGRGWEPYHVERGFAWNANTVSASYSTVWGRNLIPATSDPKALMQLIAYGITSTEAFASGLLGRPRTVLIEPGVAKILAQGGYTKESLRQDLRENGRKITYETVFSSVYGSPGFVRGTFERELARVQRNPDNEKGKLPPWYPRFPGWEEIQTLPAINQHLEILVCGDPSRNKAQVLARSQGGAVIKEIKLPSRFNQLMEQLGRPPLEEFYLKTSVTSAAKTDEKPKVSAAKTNEKPGVAANEANQSAPARTSVKSSEEPKSLDGEWTWTQRSAIAGGRDVKRRAKLTIKNGKVEGTVFGGQFGQFNVADAAIVSGEFKDGRITFVTGKDRTTTKYEGVVEGDSIKGTIDGRGRDGKPTKREWNATRAAKQ